MLAKSIDNMLTSHTHSVVCPIIQYVKLNVCVYVLLVLVVVMLVATLHFYMTLLYSYSLAFLNQWCSLC